MLCTNGESQADATSLVVQCLYDLRENSRYVTVKGLQHLIAMLVIDSQWTIFLVDSESLSYGLIPCTSYYTSHLPVIQSASTAEGLSSAETSPRPAHLIAACLVLHEPARQLGPPRDDRRPTAITDMVRV